MAKIETYPAILKSALSTSDQLIVNDASGPNTTKNVTIEELNKQWTTVDAFAAATVGSFDFVQSSTPSATASGQTWLDTDDGSVYVSSGTGTGNWGTAVYELMLKSNYTKAIGNINSPLVDLDLQNSLNLVRGAGSVTFTRSTVKNYIDRYGILQQAAINTAAFEKEGCLLEGASTNNALYASDLSNAVYTAYRGTKGTSSTVGIDGSTASNDDFTEDGANGEHYIDQFIAVTSGDIITISDFVKIKTGTRNIGIRFAVTATRTTVFDIVNGVVLSGIGKIKALGNDWYRIEATATMTSTGNLIARRQFYDGTNASYTGDSSSAYYFDGYQVENLDFASSYIITTASPVTRTADLLTLQTDGNVDLASVSKTYIADFDLLGHRSGSNQDVFRLTTTQFQLMRASGIGDIPRLSHGANSLSLNSNSSLTENQEYRIAFSILQTSGLAATIYGYIDGELSNSGSRSLVDDTKPTNITIGGGFGELFGHVKIFRIWDFELSSSEIRVA